MFKLNPHNRIRPHTWSKSRHLGELEAEAYARTVELSQAGRERTLMRFAPTSIPDPDDEIVEWAGIEAWTWEAEEDDIVPERMPDDPPEDPEFESEVAYLAEFLWDETPIEEIAWADDVGADDEHDLDFEAWVDDLDENGELSQPQFVLRTHDRDESKRGHAGDGITGRPHSYASWKVGTRARKTWAKHPHRHPTIEVWEMEVTAMGTFHDGGREAIERKLAERGIHDVKVVIIERRRAA